MGCHKMTPEELREFAARFAHEHPSFADVVRQAADALAEAQGHESGEPPEGSRLWRCERALAKARDAIALAAGLLGSFNEDYATLPETVRELKRLRKALAT